MVWYSNGQYVAVTTSISIDDIVTPISIYWWRIIIGGLFVAKYWHYSNVKEAVMKWRNGIIDQ